MASGGARLRPGPAKDPNALRRAHDKVTWRPLPIKREGETPDWPLTRPTKRELELWAHEWTRPQSVMWEESQQFLEVAMYVRQLTRCEERKATAADRRLLQTMLGDLGLTQSALAKFLWRIEGEQPEVSPRQGSVTGASAATVKDRFRVLDGTG